MTLDTLDAANLFSLTLWHSPSGYTVGVQKHAGDMVRYETRPKASEAIEAACALVRVAPLPPAPY